jgi:hypothetical protein
MSELEDLRRHIAFKRDGERSLKRVLAEHMLQALDRGEAPDYPALLRSASWPAPPRFVFHTAAREARESIERGGLTASQPGGPETGSPWSDPLGVWASQPAGVYVAEVPDLDGSWSRWTAGTCGGSTSPT